MPQAIGPYTIVREIGRGGMGIVYEGWDARLSRPVAIKTILRTADPQMRDRFLREARAAAAVSHPHICQLFDLGEQAGEPFLCMELLEGQSLAATLSARQLPVQEAAAIEIAILSALAALHRRGIVHRDLKPTNIFLTAHGVKLLDFGLARERATELDETALTMPGMVMGSPRYMAPEQVRGGEVDHRADIFAAGLVLFEMLTGRAAFGGTSAVDVLHAVVHDHPPALMGSPAILAIDRVIQRAVAKAPDDRFQSADDMAAAVRASLSEAASTEPVEVRTTRRLVVLPFRVLRPAPDVDFLAYSLPDAITVSLSSLDALTLRSSLAAARFADGAPDLRAVASELAVDAAITGTLLHVGSAVRIAVQLIEVPSGTVRWSHTAQVSLDDLFSVQDSVCSAVVEAFALPVSSHEHAALKQDVPESPEAYEYYLRANRLSTSPADWPLARDLYRRSLDADPTFAPAWARFGRVLRNMAKFGAMTESREEMAKAEEAFRRAFAINPDLPLAHNLYTYMEVESGRATDAVLRLLGRLGTRTNDADLYAGLVHACRYVGLLDASVAAYHRAVRLDPAIATSVSHSLLMMGQYQRTIDTDIDRPPYLSVMAHMLLGQEDQALAICRETRARGETNPHLLVMLELFESSIGRRFEEGRRAIGHLIEYPAFSDPEGWFYWGAGAAILRDPELAMRLLDRAVATGFHCPRALETLPMLDALRGTPAFASLLARARQGHEAAALAFTRADGHRLLGLAVA